MRRLIKQPNELLIEYACLNVISTHDALFDFPSLIAHAQALRKDTP